MSEHLMFIESLKPVGYIEIWKGFRIAANKKPNIFHLFLMKILLGWKWIDEC